MYGAGYCAGLCDGNDGLLLKGTGINGIFHRVGEESRISSCQDNNLCDFNRAYLFLLRKEKEDGENDSVNGK